LGNGAVCLVVVSGLICDAVGELLHTTTGAVRPVVFGLVYDAVGKILYPVTGAVCPVVFGHVYDAAVELLHTAASSAASIAQRLVSRLSRMHAGSSARISHLHAS
jgi:hypothetical protein